MTGPPPTKRTLAMVEAYEAGNSLCGVAAQFGLSMQRIHQIIKKYAPESIRPRGVRYGQHAGPGARVNEMIEAYKSGATLHEVAEQFGVLMQTVHQNIRRHAPNAMRPKHITRFPSVGKPGHEIYRVGSCKKCEVALFAYRPEPRKLCGHCAALAKVAA